jgi:hypothetical protein
VAGLRKTFQLFFESCGMAVKEFEEVFPTHWKSMMLGFAMTAPNEKV